MKRYFSSFHFLLGPTNLLLCIPLPFLFSLSLILLPVQLLSLLNLIHLLLNEHDQCVAPPLKLHGSSAFDEPVKPELRGTTNCCSKIFIDILFVEAKLVKHAHQESVLFLCVVLSLVGPISNPQLMERCLVPGNFGVQSFLDQSSSLDSRLTLLNLSHDTLTVLQLTAAFPECLAVLNHLLWRLPLHLSADVLHVLSTVLLVQPDELVEVPLAPVGEALLQQVFLLQLLILGQLLCFINLSLLLLLNPLGICPKVRVEGNFVANGVPVVVDLLVQQFKQTSREELEVLDDWLLWWPRCLVCLWLIRACSESLPKVSINSIVSLSLPLGRSNPVQPNVLGFVPEVLSLESINRLLLHIVNGECAQAAFAKGCKFSCCS